jgi:hypothetical protein
MNEYDKIMRYDSIKLNTTKDEMEMLFKPWTNNLTAVLNDFFPDKRHRSAKNALRYISKKIIYQPVDLFESHEISETDKDKRSLFLKKRFTFYIDKFLIYYDQVRTEINIDTANKSNDTTHRIETYINHLNMELKKYHLLDYLQTPLYKDFLSEINQILSDDPAKLLITDKQPKQAETLSNIITDKPKTDKRKKKDYDTEKVTLIDFIGEKKFEEVLCVLDDKDRLCDIENHKWRIPKEGDRLLISKMYHTLTYLDNEKPKPIFFKAAILNTFSIDISEDTLKRKKKALNYEPDIDFKNLYD